MQYLKTYSDDLLNPPKYLGYLKKSSHWVSAVRDIHEEVEGSIGSESSDCGEIHLLWAKGS